MEKESQFTAQAISHNHPLDGVSRENIKITDVKVTLLSYRLPVNEQLLVFSDIWWKTDAIIVEIFTDKDIVGIGGASRYGGDCQHVKHYIEKMIKPVICGANPFDLEFLTCGGDSNLKRCAWAGIDTALWDIVAKAKGIPVYQLLAGNRKPTQKMRCYASAGVKYAWYDRPDSLIEEALTLNEQGYTAYKFRPGTDWEYSHMTVDRFIPYLVKLRKAVGPDFGLVLEKKPWTLEQALRLAPVLEDLGFLWFEEPMRLVGDDAIDNHLRLREVLPTVMISGGEKVLDRFMVKEWIDRGAYTMLQPDASIIGLSEAWRTVQMAAIKGIPICPHNWQDGTVTMANAHLAASASNLLMLEVFETFDPLKEEIFVEPLTVVDGFMELSDKPGYGVELAPDLENRFPYIPGHFTKPNPVFK